MPATASKTGTASNYIDLYNIIRDFLTSDADLVAANEEWDQLLGPIGTLVAGDRILLRGPGLAGNDTVYCSMTSSFNAASDFYNLLLWGAAGYDSGADPLAQPLQSNAHYMGLWNQSMTYWLSANGRHWKCLVTVSTVQSFCYAGLGLNVGAIPSQYPYPYIIHGSMRGNLRFSDSDARSSNIMHPGYGTTELFFPDNNWRLVTNTVNGNNTSLNWTGATYPCYVWPTLGDDLTPAMDSPAENDISASMDANFDGSYIARELVIMSGATGPYKAPMCYLDGVYKIPGRGGISAEDTLNVNGVPCIVGQNQGRTGVNDYLAMEIT